MRKKVEGDEGEYIFRPYITTRNGQRIYARERGLKAFRIKVRKDYRPPEPPDGDSGEHDGKEQ